jgi:two-component system, NtrC family, nitrogen regulation response regulator GlnG
MSKHTTVWLVDDDASIRWVLERALKTAGLETTAFPAAEPAREALRHGRPDVMITDVRMTGESGLALLSHVRQEHPEMPVIVMTAYTDLDSAVAAYQGGAFEYLPKPFDIDEAVALVRRAAAGSSQAADSITPNPVMPELLGAAPAMQAVFRAIGRLSRSSLSVLITGESGTGKELVARALHQHSPRAGRPFIALNTAAFTRDLLESELYGHERGAYTGAERSRSGRFEQADGGTLFLDEIGDMPLELQTRLLRVLAEGEFYRVGGSVPVRVDVRVIAATHQDLDAQVAAGAFRADLLHRLNVIRIELPPLRQRREDIPTLLAHYLAAAARELNVEPKVLTPQARDRLVGAPWPGNVRQLVNACRRMTVTAPGREIGLEDLPADLAGEHAAIPDGDPGWQQALRRWAEFAPANAESPLLNRALPDFERALITVALARSGGRRQDAARLLGWGRNTLTRKMRELGFDAAR